MKNYILGMLLIALSSNTLAKELMRDGNPLKHPIPPFCVAPTELNYSSYAPNSPLAEKLRDIHDRDREIKQKQYAECKKLKIKYEKDKPEYDKEMQWRNEAIALSEKHYFSYRPDYKMTVHYAEGPALVGNTSAIILMIRGAGAQATILDNKLEQEGANDATTKEFIKYITIKYIWLRVLMEDKSTKNFKIYDSKNWQELKEEAKNIEKFLTETGGIQKADAMVEDICNRIYG